jgi:hypothetical protein
MNTARLALIFALLASMSVTAQEASENYQLRMYGLIENYEWTEELDGARIVKEDGPLYGLGGDLALRMTQALWLRGRAELYAGELDYDGYLMDEDNLTPYQSETEHVGMRLEGELGWRLPLGAGNILAPFGGLGLRAWERTLDTELGDRHIGRYGYTENWSTLYAIAGLELVIPLNNRAELFALCAAHIPLDNELTVDLENVDGPDDLELEPGKETTYRAELGLNLHPITISMYYETIEFSRSGLDKSGDYFQPDSDAEMIGAQIGLIF